jgi:hypothetical protein
MIWTGFMTPTHPPPLLVQWCHRRFWLVDSLVVEFLIIKFLDSHGFDKEVAGNTKRGKYHCTIDLLFDWFGLVCLANKNKNCQLSYSWFQTSQTGGQHYSDTSPFSIPCSYPYTAPPGAVVSSPFWLVDSLVVEFIFHQMLEFSWIW